MSDETPRLKLAQLVSLQELNAVTWNEALAQLDALIDLVLLGQYVNTPPASPVDGDAYLLGNAPSDAWSGYAYKIAVCLDGAWRFYTPFNGLRAFVAPTSAFLLYYNGLWTDCHSLISAKEVFLASATSCDLASANALFVVITGTTTITSFGSGANKLRFVRFADSLTLTHNETSLILLGGVTRTTQAGDVALYASDASGNWRELFYGRAASFVDHVTTDAAGRLLLNGQTVAYAVTNNNTVAVPALQLTGLGTDASILFGRFTVGGGPARFTFAKSRGAVRGDYAALADGDVLGMFSFNGADGSAFREAAWIRAMADGAAVAGSVAGKIVFGTTASGGTIPSDWLTIRQNGDIWIGSGNAVTPACKLDVDGAVRVKSFTVATLPAAASGSGQIAFVADEAGGAVLAFSDGSNWRRVTDRAVVS